MSNNSRKVTTFPMKNKIIIGFLRNLLLHLIVFTWDVLYKFQKPFFLPMESQSKSYEHQQRITLYAKLRAV